LKSPIFSCQDFIKINFKKIYLIYFYLKTYYTFVNLNNKIIIKFTKSRLLFMKIFKFIYSIGLTLSLAYSFDLLAFKLDQKSSFLKTSVILNSQSQPILEIDSDSVKVVEEVGGGIYDREVDALLPLFPSLVRAEWLNYKNEIAARIGTIAPSPTKESASWRNSAKSIHQLIKDAQLAAPAFKKMCLCISNHTGCKVNFGIKNQCMIKGEKSINRKVHESITEGLSREEAVGRVRDALRGTLIAETPEQIQVVIHTLKDFAYANGIQIVFINVWEENRPSGYVGIHAKMLFPISDQNEFTSQRNIIAELQIHLHCIMDGTMESVKEREHLLYDKMRKGGVDPEIQTAASTLLYLTALKQCPK
jgi:hypothetical protein